MVGNEQEIAAKVQEVLNETPDKLNLGSEYTLLDEVDWKKVRGKR